jgi:hypothetical protein
VPCELEMTIISQRKSYAINIFLCNDQHFWLNVDQKASVRQVRDQAMDFFKITSHFFEFFSLFEVKRNNNEIVGERFLNDDFAILDVISN